MTDFTPFPHIRRLSRECIVTEKIDGTNASIWIDEDGNIRAASRNRFITPSDDNAGFARWVDEHKDELLTLGPGTHFGEWWGKGIQRGYGLSEKRFSLFNTTRWSETRPACCYVVPALYQGLFRTSAVDEALRVLDATGSQAAPGFMRPEGVVVYHVAGNVMFKKTLGGDGHKGAA